MARPKAIAKPRGCSRMIAVMPEPGARTATRGDLGELALVLEEVVGLLHPAAEVEDRQADEGAEDEGHPPSPLAHGRLGEETLQDDHRGQGEQLAEHDRDELEAGEEVAAARVGDLGEVRRAGAELAPEREPLGDASHHQEDGCGDADGLVAGVEGDRQRARGHQGDRQGERGAAPAPVGVQPQHPATEGPHQEADREDHGGRQQLRGRVVRREERAGEVDREPGIDEPVEPLDEVAERGADDVRPDRTGRRGGVLRHEHAETIGQQVARRSVG